MLLFCYIPDTGTSYLNLSAATLINYIRLMLRVRKLRLSLYKMLKCYSVYGCQTIVRQAITLNWLAQYMMMLDVH